MIQNCEQYRIIIFLYSATLKK